jgi:hypothetical protein
MPMNKFQFLGLVQLEGLSRNPEGILSVNPGLRGTSYPGNAAR